MTNLSEYQYRPDYNSSDDDLSEGFYAPSLMRSDRYDRAVGFFRSTVFLAVGPPLIDFVVKGGQIRIVCSPELADDDIVALQEGYSEKMSVIESCIERDLIRLQADHRLQNHLMVLATLIKLGALEIRIAYRPSPLGPFHDKLGVFSDSAGNTVSFRGSSNESLSAWDGAGNHESFDVFCSWMEGSDVKRCARHRAYFERLWSNELTGVDTIEFPEAARANLLKVAKNAVEELPLFGRGRVSVRQPLQHQELALKSWNDHGRRGVLEHATGSGKTLTAIWAVRDHLKGGKSAIIVVPTTVLLEQWQGEIRREMPEVNLLIAGGGHGTWKQSDRLRKFTDPGLDTARVVLVTMQTASRSEFLTRVLSGPHLMLVADEVHRIGSVKFSKILTIESGPRLGLSATPVRYGDWEGTRRIFDYFGNVLEPRFTLRDAINCGRLVEYQYYPHRVFLSESESAEWLSLTAQINSMVARFQDRIGDMATFPPMLRNLLIKRARIVKKAEAKVDLALEVVKNSYETDQSWLIYCDDTDQLRKVTEILHPLGLPIFEYHSSVSVNRGDILDYYKRWRGVIVAIRCLDEGVDMPAVTHALILASSQNPREFIQRRGRILRADPQNPRKLAVIHDALVLPSSQHADETSIAYVELARALVFSRDALNRTASDQIYMMANDLQLSFEEIQSTADRGFEMEIDNE